MLKDIFKGGLGQGRQGAGEDSKGVLNNVKWIRELKRQRISKEAAAVVVKSYSWTSEKQLPHIKKHFHDVLAHGLLTARIVDWFAIPSSSGPHFVRTLHCDLSVLGGPAQRGSKLHWAMRGPSPR